MILSLAARKMEKNFRGVIEKGYPRQPYREFPINDSGDRDNSLIGFVDREMEELREEAGKLCFDASRQFDIAPTEEDFDQILDEIADVSNCLDFLYEAVLFMREFNPR